MSLACVRRAPSRLQSSPVGSARAPRLGRNRTEHDFAWTIGPTPFGYISSSTALSFSIKDAAARHALLSDVHAVTREIGAILKIFAEFRHEIEDVVTPQQHLQFVRRWNVVK